MARFGSFDFKYMLSVVDVSQLSLSNLFLIDSILGKLDNEISGAISNQRSPPSSPEIVRCSGDGDNLASEGVWDHAYSGQMVNLQRPKHSFTNSELSPIAHNATTCSFFHIGDDEINFAVCSPSSPMDAFYEPKLSVSPHDQLAMEEISERRLTGRRERLNPANSVSPLSDLTEESCFEVRGHLASLRKNKFAVENKSIRDKTEHVLPTLEMDGWEHTFIAPLQIGSHSMPINEEQCQVSSARNQEVAISSDVEDLGSSNGSSGVNYSLADGRFHERQWFHGSISVSTKVSTASSDRVGAADIQRSVAASRSRRHPVIDEWIEKRLQRNSVGIIVSLPTVRDEVIASMLQAFLERSRMPNHGLTATSSEKELVVRSRGAEVHGVSRVARSTSAINKFATWDSEFFPGGMLIVTSRAGVEQWATKARSHPGARLHVYTDALSKRRKMGAHRLSDFHVVITTFDVVRAKEVALPEKSCNSSDDEPVDECTTEVLDEDSSASDKENNYVERNRQQFQGRQPVPTSRKWLKSRGGGNKGLLINVSNLHLLQWDQLVVDPLDVPSLKAGTARGDAVRRLSAFSRVGMLQEDADQEEDEEDEHGEKIDGHAEETLPKCPLSGRSDELRNYTEEDDIDGESGCGSDVNVGLNGGWGLRDEEQQIEMPRVVRRANRMVPSSRRGRGHNSRPADPSRPRCDPRHIDGIRTVLDVPVGMPTAAIIVVAR